MKLYIIAGEASGDLHGANLIKALRAQSPGIEIRAWGGDLMKQAGATVVKHYKDLAFMGFAEVASNLGTILANFKFCKKDILHYKPDAVVLIDYPGFNLRMAKFAHQAGIKVFYYISPQLWAWNESRVKQVKNFVDRMFVILPFEKEFYKKHNMEVDFVGHPLLDAIGSESANTGFIKDWQLEGKKIVALLPGSRKQEIQKMLPVMLKACNSFPDVVPVIAKVSSIDIGFYNGLIQAFPTCKMVEGQTHGLLSNSFMALVTSGTATLETALIGIPEVVCYKGNTLSYQIAKRLVKVKYISLVNLIMDRPVVKELIQEELNSENLKMEMLKLQEDSVRASLMNDYRLLREKLGGKGASTKTATLMLKYLQP